MPNARTPSYGGGRALPVHAVLDDARADFGSGLLIRVQASLLTLRDGQILRIGSPVESLADDLETLERTAGHALLSVADDPARPGWRWHYLRKGHARTDWRARSVSDDGAVTVATVDPGRELEALMPRRLWLYTNYDCNLQCDYCCVVAGPRADPRRLPAERIRELVDDTSRIGLERVFLTGGEPMLRPDLPELIQYITDRLPLTLLTNAMLLRGSRWIALAPLIADGRPVAFQVSLDSADAELHDRHRGRGSHARALDGIWTLLAAGAHVRLAASLPEAHLDEMPRLHRLADHLGIAPEDRVIRPIALRGAATEGEPIRPEDVAPELTCDALGWFWHPLSNDPDMRLEVEPGAGLAEAMAAVHGRLETMLASRAARLDRFVCG
jgi:organic radical activating enzyme